MSPRVANIVFFFFEAVAVLAAVYVAYVASATLQAINSRVPVVHLDTGVFFLLLMLIFPWLHLCGALVRKGLVNEGGLTWPTLGFFAALAVVGWGGGWFFSGRVLGAGYARCPGATAHRVALGERSRYALDPEQCPPAGPGR